MKLCKIGNVHQEVVQKLKWKKSIPCQSILFPFHEIGPSLNFWQKQTAKEQNIAKKGETQMKMRREKHRIRSADSSLLLHLTSNTEET